MDKEWLGSPSIKKHLRKVQRIEARNAREPFGVGSRGPLNGPSGVQEQSSCGGLEGEAPGSFCVFQCRNSIFNANYKIVKFNGSQLGKMKKYIPYTPLP